MIKIKFVQNREVGEESGNQPLSHNDVIALLKDTIFINPDEEFYLEGASVEDTQTVSNGIVVVAKVEEWIAEALKSRKEIDGKIDVYETF